MKKYLKLNESTESAAIFMTLIPGDYHGYPAIHETFITGESGGNFPKIPTEKEVFDAWLISGYSDFAASGGGTEEDKSDLFQTYGNKPLYYAIYFIIIDGSADMESVLDEIKDWIDGLMNIEGEGEDPATVVKILNDIEGITYAAYID